MTWRSAIPAGRPLRVAFVIDTLRPGAGTENQLILMLEHLDRRRVDPVVFCLSDNPHHATLALGCPIRVLGVQKLLGPKGLRGILLMPQWIRELDLDLVVTFFRDSNFLGTLAYEKLTEHGSPGLANIARIAILGLVLAMGLKAMGLADNIVSMAFGFTLGSVAVAAALAFGLGGRDAAKSIADDWAKKIKDQRST